MKVFDNYQAIVRISDYKVGDLACYVPPDNVLPDKPEYAFLKGKLRIKSTKLRGMVSQGLVLPAPEGAGEGDDVAEQIGITHYIPRMIGARSGGGGFAGDTSSDLLFLARSTRSGRRSGTETAFTNALECTSPFRQDVMSYEQTVYPSAS